MTAYVNVGKIVNTHGIKGEVRVISDTDFPEERYQPGAELIWLGNDESDRLTLTVASHRQHKQFDLVKFESYPTINEAESLVGGTLNVTEADLATLDDDTFYWHDIVGLTAYDEAGTEIGQVKEILSSGANDVWVISRRGQKDLLLPYIDEVVKDVNLTAGTITVHVLEGLDD